MRPPSKALDEGECFIGSSAYIAIMDGRNGVLLFYIQPDTKIKSVKIRFSQQWCVIRSIIVLHSAY